MVRLLTIIQGGAADLLSNCMQSGRLFMLFCIHNYASNHSCPASSSQGGGHRTRAAGVSFSEFVRRAVEKAVTENRQRPGRDPLLNDHAIFNGGTPQDLSRRHDAYLYGEA